MVKVARAVEYAHAHGVLHRDLKPSNILLDLEGVPHVTDFGLARCVATDSSLTQTGLILGTPAYMAPEQVSQRPGELTEAVDIYGLGAVLYKLLTGLAPFQAPTMYQVLEQVQEREPSSLRLFNRAVDRDLDAICLKCLEKDPARRYESAAALSSDLNRWLAGSSISARCPSSVERSSRWYHQNRKQIAYSAIMVGLVTVFVLAGITTAEVICNYELAGEPARKPLRRPRPLTRRAPKPTILRVTSRTSIPARRRRTGKLEIEVRLVAPGDVSDHRRALVGGQRQQAVAGSNPPLKHAVMPLLIDLPDKPALVEKRQVDRRVLVGLGTPGAFEPAFFPGGGGWDQSDRCPLLRAQAAAPVRRRPLPGQANKSDQGA